MLRDYLLVLLQMRPKIARCLHLEMKDELLNPFYYKSSLKYNN
jgi:hypothetical protein